MTGPAIVGASIWRGPVVAAGHAVLPAVSWAVVSTPPQLGAASARTALAMSLTVTVTAVGMVQAGEAADALARRVDLDQVEQTLSGTLAAERTQLDRLIPDDVMTTLTSAALARDADTTEATRSRARETLARISALEQPS